MKVKRYCNSCGAPVDPKKTSCPYCGTVYDPEKLVEREIRTRTVGYTGLVIRLSAVAALLAAIIIAAVVGGNSWNIHYSMRDLENDRNGSKYRETYEQYLKDGEYMDAASFLEYHQLNGYNNGFDGLTEVTDISKCYLRFVESMLEATMPKVPNEYESDSVSYHASDVADRLSSFYREYERVLSYQEDEWYRERYEIDEQMPYINGMEAEVRSMTEVYLGFSEEELEEFLSTSDTRQTLMIEEVLQHE